MVVENEVVEIKVGAQEVSPASSGEGRIFKGCVGFYSSELTLLFAWSSYGRQKFADEIQPNQTKLFEYQVQLLPFKLFSYFLTLFSEFRV